MDKNFFSQIFANTFFINALLAGILASFASGIMGSYVVAKKISSLSGSIAHSILGGVGLTLFLKYKYQITWLDPIYGAFLAAIISALLIGYIHLKHSQNEDAAIAAIWSTGMGIGVIFISLVPSFSGDFTHFLFGNLMLVSKTHLYLLFCLNIIILFTVCIFYRRFLAICVDEEMAYLQNVNVNALYLLLLSLISISIVLLIQIMGIILVIALLTLPPTISNLFSKKLYIIMALSFFFCLFFNFFGIALSYKLNYPPGATIAIISALFYLFFLLNKKKFIIKNKRAKS